MTTNLYDRRVRLSFVMGVWGLLSLVSPVAQASAVVNIKGNLTEGTCDVYIPVSSTVKLGVFVPQDFNDNNGTAGVKVFQIGMNNCNLPGGVPAVQVSGATLTGDNTIFSDSPTAPAGFMLKDIGQGNLDAWSGALSAFIAAPGTVTNGDYTHDSFTGSPQTTLLNYAVGFAAPANVAAAPPGGLEVSAVVTFDFIYH